MSYLCISYAESDVLVAQRFCHELTKYGFRYECINQNTPLARREVLIDQSRLLLVLTSSAAEVVGSCAADLRRRGSMGLPCLCVSLSKNQLDERFGLSGGEGGVPVIPYPAGETDTPDERSVALFVHRLYVLRLCRLRDCFMPSRCVDDVYGRMIAGSVKGWDGDPEAQYAVGMAYAHGAGVPMLETETAEWMRKAAKAGYVPALIRMGELLLDGEGVERDPAEALRLFSAAAKAGDARGQYYRGICCLYGYGLMKDPEMAVRYLRVAAGMGYAPALYRLGLLYRDGVGTQASWRKAVKYLYLAACPEKNIPLYGDRFLPPEPHADRPYARRFVCVSMRFMRQKLVALALSRGQEDRAKQLEKFGMTYCRSRRVSYPEDDWLYDLDASYDSSRYNKNRGYSHQRWDKALAEGALGRLLELGSPKEGICPSPRAAFWWYRQAMKHGHSGAMFRLGDAYRSGKGVPAHPEQAVRLFRRAAEFGNVRGQFAMGVCCEIGQGLPVSLIEAVRWYEMAAEAGYAPAQNNLGGCYENGLGVSVDHLTAVEWYTKASVQGQPDAACRLGLCYECGRGVPQSQERAFHLFEDAARRGHPYALYRLGLCYDLGMTVPPQVAYAAHLYERAARSGVGDAAYAMALCCREGRGVRKNLQESFEWLSMAADLGSVQGCFEAGLCYFEGHTALQNKALAMKYFARAVSLYDAMMHTDATRTREDMDGRLPVDCMTVTEAVGGALYMLGYGYLTQEPPDLPRAMTYFKESARMDRCEAMTALGDLYAYGLVEGGLAEDNQKTAMTYYETAAKGSETNALLSLAMMYQERGQALAEAQERDNAAFWYEKAWRSLARCAEQGHAYALVGMAGCAWLGHGTTQNPETAKWFLDRATHHTDHRMHKSTRFIGFEQKRTEEAEGCALASLWLGDLYFSALQQAQTKQQARELVDLAKEAYTMAIHAPDALLERFAYVVPARLQKRRQIEDSAKVEAHYRLAVLQMLYAQTPEDSSQAFGHLGVAVRSGHELASRDFARLYAYWKEKQEQTAPQSTQTKGKKGKKVPQTTPKKRLEDLGGGYYLALMPVPCPFALSMLEPTPVADAPWYVTAQVTPAMLGVALNHLGDRYFYGDGVAEDKVAAVACYRKAAETPLPRGGEASYGGIVWAQYSLGYCLLEGMGTAKNPKEAVRWLSRAAKYHGEAAYCLAKCYEWGLGVDSEDIREALKFYRKAEKLGCAVATSKIPQLEKRLREIDDD